PTELTTLSLHDALPILTIPLTLSNLKLLRRITRTENILHRSLTIPLTLSNLKLLRRITRTENILHRNFTRRQVAIQNRVASNIGDRKSGSAGMPRPISYAVFCLKKKKHV